MIKKSIISSLLLSGLVGCAATYESAEESYRNGEVSDAREAWTELAENGDGRSMYRLYSISAFSSEKNIEWLKKAADAEVSDAQYDYGLYLIKNKSYKDGQNYLRAAAKNSHSKAQAYLEENKALLGLLVTAELLPQSSSYLAVGDYYWGQEKYKEALVWFEQCGKTSGYCSFYMGLAYDNGYGTEQDYEKSNYWYRISFDLGEPASARNLAWHYESGQGVVIDKAQAFAWMKKGLASGDNAQTSLGRYYHYGIGTKQDYQKAYELYNKVAKWNEHAAYRLGLLYYYGHGVEQDYDKANAWFLEASKKQHAAATYYIGDLYYYGYGRDKNYREAIKWYEKASDLKDEDAQFRLGWMYNNGEGVAIDSRKAFQYYLLSAEQGNVSAQNNLGVMYAGGRGTEKNEAKAFEWYQRAAEKGDSVAQSNLGGRYEFGNGVQRSNELAAYWYAKSAQQNHKAAQSSIRNMLYKLRYKNINVKSTEVREEANFDSQAIKELNRGAKVYVLSEGSQWTEIYYPEHHTIGFIHNSHLI